MRCRHRQGPFHPSTIFICGCSVFQEGVFAGTCYLEQVPNAIHKIPHRVEGHDVWVRVWRIPRVVRVRGPLACYSLRESGDYITLHYIITRARCALHNRCLAVGVDRFHVDFCPIHVHVFTRASAQITLHFTSVMPAVTYQSPQNSRDSSRNHPDMAI